MDKFEADLVRAWPQAKGVALKVLGAHRGLVEDVLQAAALKAWLHYGDFRGDSQFKTWFTRVVINEALMELRRVKPLDSLDEPWLEGMTVADTVVSHRANPEDQLLGKERRRLLAKEILGLTPKLRQAMLLYSQGGHAKSSTEKARRFMGRQKLRERLEGRL